MPRAAVAIIALIIGLAAGGTAGWFADRLAAAFQLADKQYDHDCELAWPVLSSDPAFRELGPLNYPVGGFCLVGEVPTGDDYDRLRKEMIRLFGEPRIKHVMNDVTVKAAPAQRPARTD